MTHLNSQRERENSHQQKKPVAGGQLQINPVVNDGH
jgi:hypothetical protein